MPHWRVYKHKMRFIHNVEDSSALRDKTCLKPHEHGFEPNQVCVCEFIVKTREWVDFKVIKELAIKNIESIANSTNLSGSVPYYDFGTMDTETMSKDLSTLMTADLKKLNLFNVVVQIWLDETDKYAIWYDGVN